MIACATKRIATVPRTKNSLMLMLGLSPCYSKRQRTASIFLSPSTNPRKRKIMMASNSLVKKIACGCALPFALGPRVVDGLSFSLSQLGKKSRVLTSSKVGRVSVSENKKATIQKLVKKGAKRAAPDGAASMLEVEKGEAGAAKGRGRGRRRGGAKRRRGPRDGGKTAKEIADLNKQEAEEEEKYKTAKMPQEMLERQKGLEQEEKRWEQQENIKRIHPEKYNMKLLEHAEKNPKGGAEVSDRDKASKDLAKKMRPAQPEETTSGCCD